jgi:chloride channel protein, CIC family
MAGLGQWVVATWDEARGEVRQAFQVLRHRGPSQIQFWFIALVIGIAAGAAALFFRKGISALLTTFYGTNDMHLASVAGGLPWWWIMVLPVLGGLAVGIILHLFTPDGRARSVADVIEGAALRNGRVEKRAGLASALASLITLGTGGSSGREGPVVHLAAVISSWVSNRINADGITGRDLLGCAVAAAVSASFNAPIAGTLFALEVVLRHFAVHAFAPITIAAVAGTVINRLEFGNVTEFHLSASTSFSFYVELPAFMMLGMICGLVAVALMRAIFWADDIGNQVQKATGMPRWLRPALAGGMLGALAIGYPQIIGVGYETTSAALTGRMLLHEAVVLAVVKAVAVAITLGGRMGGGVFSPAMVLGSLTGLSFGLIATAAFPEVSGAETLYALAGMGAVAAAVLGAPISTTLIVFELTGDWQTGLAVMVAVSLSTAIASRMVDRSFFLTQLERRNTRIAAGPQAWVLTVVRVRDVMRPTGSARMAPTDRCWELIEAGTYLDHTRTLDRAMVHFESGDVEFVPIINLGREGEAPELLGALFHVDALRAYNRALAEAAAEEHS